MLRKVQLISFETGKIIPEPTELSRPGFKAPEGAIIFFETEKIIPEPMEPRTSGLKAPEGAINFFRHGKNYSGANGAS